MKFYYVSPVGRSKVEALKRSWHRDPCWDLAETPGFEDYYPELLAFEKQSIKEWAEIVAKQKQKQKDKYCPMSFNVSGDRNTIGCQLDKCAWWDTEISRCAPFTKGTMRNDASNI